MILGFLAKVFINQKYGVYSYPFFLALVDFVSLRAVPILLFVCFARKTIFSNLKVRNFIGQELLNFRGQRSVFVGSSQPFNRQWHIFGLTLLSFAISTERVLCESLKRLNSSCNILEAYLHFNPLFFK